jgi:hypothetical protein
MFIAPLAAAAPLYSQNFETPNVAIVTNSQDVGAQLISTLHDRPGFVFAQFDSSIETLDIAGGRAFGTGYSDPAGIGGRYSLGMLATAFDDRLGLSFNTAGNPLLGISLDISSIDLNCCGGPFVPAGGEAPVFTLRLFDNPSGLADGDGNGVLLDSATLTGSATALKTLFQWTSVTAVLDASGSTTGNVTLQFDLAAGGYAAFDNLEITAVPEPSTLLLLGAGLAGLYAVRRGRGTPNLQRFPS